MALSSPIWRNRRKSDAGFPTPADATSVVAWFDFSDTSKVSVTGADIDSITDKINGYVCSSTGSARPQTSTENGLQASIWNGDNYLESTDSALTDIVSGTDTQWAVIAAFKHAAGSEGCVWSFGNSAANNYYALRNTSSVYRLQGADTAGALSNIDCGAEQDDTVIVMGIAHNGDSLDSFYNSSRTNNNASQAGGSVPVNRFTIGDLIFNGGYNVSTLPFVGEILEIVVLNTNDVGDDMVNIMAYMQNKWANAPLPLNKVPDLHALLGQSNAVGDPRGVGDDPLEPKYAYEINNDTYVVTVLQEPIGGDDALTDPADEGSMAGGLAVGWKGVTKRGSLILPFAKGGSGLLDPVADEDWDPATGNLYPAFKSALEDVLIQPQIATDYRRKIMVWWVEGESAATLITDNTNEGSDYFEPFVNLAESIDTDFPTAQLSIIRSSTRTDSNGAIDDTDGFNIVRNVQEAIADFEANAILAYRPPIDDATIFRGNNQVHYNQTALNTIGLGAAQQAATSVLADEIGDGGLTPSYAFLAPFSDSTVSYSLRGISPFALDYVLVRQSISDAEHDFNETEITDDTLLDYVVPDSVQALYNNAMYFDGIDNYVVFDAFDLRSKTFYFDFIYTDAEKQIMQIEDFSNSGRRLVVTLNSTLGGSSDIVVETEDVNNLNPTAFEYNSMTHGELYTAVVTLDSSAKVTALTINGNNGAVGGVSRASPGTPANQDKFFLGIRSGGSFEYTGVIKNLEVVGHHQWDGDSNTDAGWVDNIGSNDGVVNGSPALFTGQGFNGAVASLLSADAVTINATQTTADKQPMLVENGALVTLNGEPAIKLDGTDDNFDFDITLTGDFLINWVGSIADFTNAPLLGGTDYIQFTDAGTLVLENGTTSTITMNSTLAVDTQYLIQIQRVSNTITVYINGTAQTDTESNSGDFDFEKIGNEASNYLEGKIQEIIIYNNNQSANRAGMASNINNHYGIY